MKYYLVYYYGETQNPNHPRFPNEHGDVVNWAVMSMTPEEAVKKIKGEWSGEPLQCWDTYEKAMQVLGGHVLGQVIGARS